MRGNSLSGSIPSELASVDFEAGSTTGYCALMDTSPTNVFTCPLPDGLGNKCDGSLGTVTCINPPLSRSAVNAAAIYSLYVSTDGEHWINNGGWPASAAEAADSGNDPCLGKTGAYSNGNWNGVACYYDLAYKMCAPPSMLPTPTAYPCRCHWTDPPRSM